MSKIRDMQIVDTYVRIAPCEFQRVWIFDVSLTGSQTLKMELKTLRTSGTFWYILFEAVFDIVLGKCHKFK